jgi:hypothetical protein
MKPALVYIAGPYRASDPWEVERNVRSAELWIPHIAALGVVPICVHSMYRFFDKSADVSADYWIKGTLEIMRRCDAVFVRPGDYVSEGTEGEINEANALGIPVFKTLRGLCGWISYSTRGRFEVLA